jgi:hypothetical protein
MNDIQWFGFVILPTCVGIFGLIAGWATRFIP